MDSYFYSQLAPSLAIFSSEKTSYTFPFLNPKSDDFQTFSCSHAAFYILLAKMREHSVITFGLLCI